MLFLPGSRVLSRAWLVGIGCRLRVCMCGLLGGMKGTAVGRWVEARGLSRGQMGAQGSGVGDLGGW